MANKFLAVSDGTFTLQESENKNQFYFYRNDGEVLTDVNEELMDLYHAYIFQKMVNGEINMVMNNIYSEISGDGKCIRLTISNIGEKLERDQNSTVSDKPSGFMKRLLHKIFG